MSRIIVIGAGVIGLACAYELRRRGHQVMVVDRGEPGAACSSGNAGWVVPSLCGPVPAPGLVGTSLRWMLTRDSPLYIRPRPDLEFLGWVRDFWRYCTSRAYQAGLAAIAALNVHTMALYDALQADGMPVEMHRQGILFTFLDHAALGSVYADLERVRSYGYGEAKVLTAREAREAEPMLGNEAIGGILVEQQRHVRPETLTGALVRRLQEMSVEVKSGAEVTDFHWRGAAIAAAQTPRGLLEGDRFVIAAGAWSGLLARRVGYRLPMQAGKGYSLTLVNPRVNVRRPLYLDEARIAVSNFDGALRLAGTMEFSGLNSDLDPRRLAALRRGADRYLTDWQGADREKAWVGMRPLTPDGLPVIGKVPGCENVYIATGHGMLGVTLAPATAVALTELIVTDRSTPALAPFDPARFVRQRHS